jgi:uncharacterized Fe-S cluster protein YjdI
MTPTRTYSHNGMTVEWRAELCTKCGNCKTGLPEVFNPERRPWVRLELASSDSITSQVAACPSGALALAPNQPEAQP